MSDAERRSESVALGKLARVGSLHMLIRAAKALHLKAQEMSSGEDDGAAPRIEAALTHDVLANTSRGHVTDRNRVAPGD